MAAESDRALDWTDLDAATLYRAVVDGLSSGIFLVTTSGTIALVNCEAEQRFGYARDELIGQPIERFIPDARSPTGHSLSEGDAGDLSAAPGDPAIRGIGVRHDGSRFDVDIRIRPVGIANLTGAVIEVHPTREEPVRAAHALASIAARRARRAIEAVHGVAESPAARQVTEMIEQVAATSSTVLLLGETGTGKELFAAQLHELSARRQQPMVRVNCAAIPVTLIESELFGREKGAFTGALARQVGRFELADKGTIFLDEIGDLPLDVQVKLLRVLEEGQVERLGSPRSIHIDTRIIAATHQDLEQRIAEGAFREDLFYRLNVFPIRVPALRERVEDIPHLVWQFVGEFSKSFGRRIESISTDSLAALREYPWPGNIRELRNTVERAMIVSTGTVLTIAAPSTTPTAARRSLKLIDVEKQHLQAVLESTHWRIRGDSGAAVRLGLKPTTLETRMARLGLKRPDHR